MRPHGGRKKKLILAFHFQQSDQARWKCENCRTAGLDRKRCCNFLAEPTTPETRPVWAKGRVFAKQCPKSIITAQSLVWVEEYYAWRLLGRASLTGASARQVDAFCVLEGELKAEERHGER